MKHTKREAIERALAFIRQRVAAEEASGNLDEFMMTDADNQEFTRLLRRAGIKPSDIFPFPVEELEGLLGL